MAEARAEATCRRYVTWSRARGKGKGQGQGARGKGKGQGQLEVALTMTLSRLIQLCSHRATGEEIEPGTSRPSVSRFSYLHQGVDISMLRQLVAGQGCTDDAGPSTSSNPLAGLFSHMLGTTKHNEYLHEVRTTIPTFSKIDQDKIRNRSHIHTRHLFPGATTTK
jgi:hypothetical protein